MSAQAQFIFIYCFFTTQVMTKALPLTIKIFHHESNQNEGVQKNLEKDHGLKVEINSQIEPKIENFEVPTGTMNDVDYEWDCSVPVKPDILQPRRVRDILATLEESSEQSLVQTTLGGLNGIALNIMHIGYGFIDKILPRSGQKAL